MRCLLAMMAKYSTISLPKELYEILQKLLENKPEWGYNSVADFCKEAIRLHLSDVKQQLREDFWRKLDTKELFKKIEMASECNQSLYQDAFKSIKDMAFILSKDFRIKDVNKMFEYLLNYRKTDVFKEPIKDFIEKWNEIERELKANDYIRDFETKIIRKDGKKLDILVTINRVRDNYFGVAKDITIRKAVEEKMKKEKELYEYLLNQIYNGIVVVQNGKIKFVNSATTVSGYSPEELIGKKVEDIVTPEYREILRKNIERKLKGKGEGKPEYYKITAKDGRIMEIEAISRRIEFDGNPALLTCIRVIENK